MKQKFSSILLDKGIINRQKCYKKSMPDVHSVWIYGIKQLQQQQQQHLLTQIIYKAMIHEYTEYKISEIE